MAFTFSYVIDETHGVGRTYGHRLNGDFFLLSSFPFEHDCPHGTRQHDAIGAVKPLSPPALWWTVSSLTSASELCSVLPRYYLFHHRWRI